MTATTTTSAAARPWPDDRPAAAREPAAAADQILLQALCLLVTFTVIFPILWIFSLALDPRDVSRPDGLIPPGASLDAFARVIAQPTSDEISLLELAWNSFLLAIPVAVLGRDRRARGLRLLAPAVPRPRVLMIAILGVLMLPAVATIAPLFIMLNGVRLDLPVLGEFNLRQSLIGVGVAVVSGACRSPSGT